MTTQNETVTEKMTIAQALRRIKKLKGQLSEHQSRATAGVTYDVTKVPSFRFDEEVASMVALSNEVVDLETRVAVANANSTVSYNGDSKPLTAAIRTLQELKGRIAFLKGLNLRNETVKERTSDIDEVTYERVTRVTETTFKSDLSEQDRDKQVKALQNVFEELNNKVEDANHNVVV